MRKALIALVLTALAAQPLLAVEPANVAGKWRITIATPSGQRVAEHTIVQNKGKITLTWGGRDGQVQKAEGTVTGNTVQWTVTRQTPNGSFSLVYTGQVEGDLMRGTAEGPPGKVDWVGEKINAQ
jgi:hypothetical protein